MTRVLVVGACGRMGQSLVRAIEASGDLRLGAALEHAAHPSLGQVVSGDVKLGADARAACAQADVAVDFSSPASSLALLEVAEARGLPLVIGTTGLDAAGEARIAYSPGARPTSQRAARSAPATKFSRESARCESSTRSPGPAKYTVCSPTLSPSLSACRPMLLGSRTPVMPWRAYTASFWSCWPRASAASRASAIAVPLGASFFWLWCISSTSIS